MRQQLTPLTPGDRLVNFGLPDATGTNRVFYWEVTGGPIVLVAYGTIEDPEQKAGLAGIVAQGEAFAALGAQVFAVSGDGIATNLATTEQLGLAFPLFSDRQGALLPRVLAAEPSGLPESEAVRGRFATYVLDPNQRVLEVFRQPPAETHGARALEIVESWLSAGETGSVLRYGAPVLVLPRVLDPELCRTVIEDWQKEHHEAGMSDGTKNVFDTDKKQTLEHVIMDPALSRRISRTLVRRIGPELAKVFHYNARFRFEGYTVMSYRADRKDFFAIHRDDLRQTGQRRFAMSLNLNEGYEGGAIRFPEYGPHTYSPKAGGALVFSCALLHEALPVTRGQRFVMTTFFCDPEPDLSKSGPGRPTVQI